MTLKDLVAEHAKGRFTKAYEILGAEPGPGLDIIFIPDLPVAHTYTIKCLTIAGAGFIRVLYNGQGRISEGRDFTRMKRELSDFGLAFHVDWSQVVEAIE